MELSGFDANAVEPAAPREILPAGWYKAVITASEERPTKAQTGSFLLLNMEVIEGEYQGRKINDRLNLNNPSAVAVDIAQRTLSAICRAVGVMTPRSSPDLHDKPMMVKIKVKPAAGEYTASNEVDGYEAASNAAAPPVAAATTAKKPWGKK